LGGSIADTAVSSKALRGLMGIESVPWVGERGTEMGALSELGVRAASREWNEGWGGMEKEVVRSRLKESGHTTTDAGLMGAAVFVDWLQS
jgi:hypothetical protein